MTEKLDTNKHNVDLDSAGWAGRARLTCYTCNVTCLKQPYMNREQWAEKVREFCEAHPSENRIVTSYCVQRSGSERIAKP